MPKLTLIQQPPQLADIGKPAQATRQNITPIDMALMQHQKYSDG